MPPRGAAPQGAGGCAAALGARTSPHPAGEDCSPVRAALARAGGCGRLHWATGGAGRFAIKMGLSAALGERGRPLGARHGGAGGLHALGMPPRLMRARRAGLGPI